ncbi:ABC transporter substrate-binding protein [Micromonospora sp. NPDC000207]|uniref:ABC transporter substrate-binding protein n=1 Tax=Micromonospora sp. NPDC000207 TaxID=3154246 RepID=UPI0033226399
MSQMNRRRALQLLAGIGAVGLVGGCGSDDEDSTTPTGAPIKIGLIAPTTGALKPIGTEIVNGFQLYLDRNAGQLGGRPVELVVADEGENARSGQAAVDNLLKQGVLALTGVVNPAVMIAIRDAVEEARVPLIGSNASPASLQSVVYIWRTSYVLNEPGEAMGAYLGQELPASARVAILAPENAGSRDVIAGFRNGFGPDDQRIAGEVVFTDDTAQPGNTAYVADIERALARNPTAVFCFYSGQAAVQFVKQLRRTGYQGPIYAPGFLTEGTVLGELREQEATGISTALNYSADLNNTANRQFASDYRKSFDDSPTTYAMASYDAAQVLDAAIRLAGDEPSPQEVNLALGRIGQIDSPRGAWQFNQSRTPQQRWYLRTVQRDGQLLSNVLINELVTLG